MFISPIYGSRVYNRQNTNVQFTGLTRRMEREMYIDGKKDILEIINERGENKSTVVGQLPPGIFYRLPKENRTQAITEIMNTFNRAITESMIAFLDFGFGLFISIYTLLNKNKLLNCKE